MHLFRGKHDLIANRGFLAAAGVALLVWTAWLTLGDPAPWQHVQAHWEVTLTMVFGSLIAGATSEGGGAVAFPVFTKLLAVAPGDAKVFALAIQSVGMTAASVVIVARGIPVEWRAIGWASLGGVPGIVLGSALLAPLLPPALVKMSFTVMVTSFAVTLFALNRGLAVRHQRLPLCGGRERGLLLAAGFVGGIMSGLVGNGIDIVTFSLLVLLFRVSEKVATPSSVILMAGNAVVGFALHGFVLGGFGAQVQAWWLAAVPVVVVGAPLGALICSRLGRRTVANVLIALIAVELAGSLALLPMSGSLLLASLAALALCSALFAWMARSRTYALA